MEYSKQQERIVKKLEKYNVVVNAVPGSGKTTTIVKVMEEFQEDILCLTFSKRLQVESSKKKPQGCKNCHFFTLSGFSYQYYGNMNKISGTKKKNFYFSIVIFDECQDFGEVDYRFVKKILRDNQCEDCRLLILGDERQNVYFEYQKVLSDSRYLTLASRIFPGEKWKHCSLSQSFRLTTGIAEFVNKAVLNSNISVIRTEKEGPKPRYIVTSSNPNPFIIQEIHYYLEQGYTEDDIFIITHTVTKFQGVKDLMNELSRLGFLIYRVGEDEQFSSKCAQRKLSFMTHHSSKGLENKVVLILGFDCSYYSCFRHTEDECPNPLFVSLTRSMERLTMFQSGSKLGFLNMNYLIESTNYIAASTPTMNTGLRHERTIPVTEFLKKVKSTSLAEFIDQLIIKQDDECAFIEIPEIIAVDETETCEYVADISGIAIASFFEYTKTNKMSIYESLRRDVRYREKYKTFPKEVTIPYLLECSLDFNCHVDGTIFRSRQIMEKDWITQRKLTKCRKRMEKSELFEDKGKFEKRFEKRVETKDEIYSLRGVCDYIDKKKIVEVKCKRDISNEDYLQVLLYCFLNGNKHKAYLFNVLRNQIYRIDYSHINLDEWIFRFFTEMNQYDELSDEEFIEKCLR